MMKDKRMKWIDWTILGWLVFKTAMDIVMVMYVVLRLGIKK